MKRNFFLLIIAVCFTSTVYAEKFDLNVYASKFDSIPIGVLEFTSKNGAQIQDNKPWLVIANDLDFCGRFNVVSRSQFDSAAFAAGNVGIYIDGEYSLRGDSIEMTCFLKDATTKELIIGKKYKGDLKSSRAMAHRYCNEIVEMLFGEKGIFESRILFVKTEGSKKEIAIMDFDGYNQKNVTNNNKLNLFPTFADNNTVIWTSYLRGKPDLYKGSIASGSSKIFIYSRGIQSSPDVSPVDGTIAFASSKNGNLDIYTCNPDGTNVRQLTTGYGVDTSPAWSPNGYQIAFTSDRTGNPQIYVMDADGANQRRVTFETKYADSPAWSPRGDKIAYQSMDQNSKFDIWIVNVDGSGATKITGQPGNNEYPTWSPDGSLIAYVNTYGGKGDLYIVKPDGSRVKKVTSGGNVKMPDWSGF
jgi:TolB protein